MTLYCRTRCYLFFHTTNVGSNERLGFTQKCGSLTHILFDVQRMRKSPGSVRCNAKLYVGISSLYGITRSFVVFWIIYESQTVKLILFSCVRIQKLKEMHLIASLFLSICLKYGFSRNLHLWIRRNCWRILFLILDHCNGYFMLKPTRFFFCVYLDRSSAFLGKCIFFVNGKTEVSIPHFILSRIFRSSFSFINNLKGKNQTLPRKFLCDVTVS